MLQQDRGAPRSGDGPCPAASDEGGRQARPSDGAEGGVLCARYEQRQEGAAV